MTIATRLREIAVRQGLTLEEQATIYKAANLLEGYDAVLRNAQSRITGLALLEEETEEELALAKEERDGALLACSILKKQARRGISEWTPS